MMKNTWITFMLIFFCSIAVVSEAAVSPFDGFDPDADGPVYAIAFQDDGKVLIGGGFTNVYGTGQSYLARLNGDGSLDSSFTPVLNAMVIAIVVQPDGKILLGGTFTSVNGSIRTCMALLNKDGSLDAGFAPNISPGPGVMAAFVYDIVVQADNKIVFGGVFGTVNGKSRSSLARIHADGTLDTGFNPSTGYAGSVSKSAQVVTLALQKDGKILLAGYIDTVNGTARSSLARLNQDGSLDHSFNPAPNGFVYSLAVQPDGKIWAAGLFSEIGKLTRTNLALLNNDGSVDTRFDKVVEDQVSTVTLQPDGKILFGGRFSSVAGQTRNNIARLHPDLTLDMEFYPEISGGWVFTLAVQPDGKVLLGGEFTSVDNRTCNYIARLNIDNTLDDHFTPAANARVISLAVQPDGKILAGGAMTDIDTNAGNYLFRLNGDGTVDTSFIDPQINDDVYSLAVQADGKILLGGTFTALGTASHPYIARLEQNGTVDGAFAAATDGPVRAIVLQPDGKIIIGGSFTTVNGIGRNRLARLNADGSLDADFNPDADGNVVTLALQPDGKILVGGLFVGFNAQTQTQSRVARLNADGSLDANFHPQVNNIVSAVAVQRDGKIVLGGTFTEVNGTTRNSIARLNADGTLDNAFNPNANNAVADIAIQVDGKIIVGGAFTQFQQSTLIIRNHIARLNNDGSVDSGFNANVDDLVHCLALQQDGKVILGGDFATVNTLQPRVRLARISADEAALQSLSVNSEGDGLTWRRSGTGPELEKVTFALSDDLKTWTSLGAGTRVAGGWQGAIGTVLPEEEYRYIRCRGYYTSGTFAGSVSMMETVWQVYRSRTGGGFYWPMFLPATIGGAQ